MGYRNCPKCNEMISDNVKHCPICGEGLQGVAAQRDFSDMEPKRRDVELERSFPCPECQMTLKPGTRHCPYCAALIAKTSYDLAERGAPRYRRYPTRYAVGDSSGCLTAVLYILAIVFPIVGIIIGVIFLTSSDPAKNDLGKSLVITAAITMAVCFAIWVICLMTVMSGVSSPYSY